MRTSPLAASHCRFRPAREAVPVHSNVTPLGLVALARQPEGGKSPNSFSHSLVIPRNLAGYRGAASLRFHLVCIRDPLDERALTGVACEPRPSVAELDVGDRRPQAGMDDAHGIRELGCVELVVEMVERCQRPPGSVSRPPPLPR
jgi:hypothetical protein